MTKSRMQNAKIAITNYLKELTPELQQLMNGAMEKRALSWLSALPIKATGYVLNKLQFMDAIYMRYGWRVKGIPTSCMCLWRDKLCGLQPHAPCKLVDYTSMRHNSVRDLEAQIMREVCYSVEMFRQTHTFAN